MGKWLAALRALIRDQEPALGFLEVLAVWPGKSKRFGTKESPAPARTLDEVRRVLAWMVGADRGAVGFPDGEVLIRQILDGYAAVNPVRQRRIREEVASHLGDAADPRFTGALLVAARLPLPEAKSTFLGLLTTPLPRLAAYRVAADSSPFGGRGGRGRDSTNGHAEGLDYRAAVIAALGALRDPQLQEVFQRVLAKYLDRGRSDPARMELCREAAVALVLLDAEALARSLPPELNTDPLLLARLAERPEPEVRRAVSAWVEALPQVTRSRLSGGLAAFKAQRSGAAPAGG